MMLPTRAGRFLLPAVVFSIAAIIAAAKGPELMASWLVVTAIAGAITALALTCVSVLTYFSPPVRARRLAEYRRRHGLCLRCGYDLRAQLVGAAGDKCPECGTLIPDTPSTIMSDGKRNSP